MDAFFKSEPFGHITILILGVMSLLWIVTLLGRRPVRPTQWLLAALILSSFLIAFFSVWTVETKSLPALFVIPILKWANIPLVFFFFRHQLHPPWKFQRRNWLHFIPSLVLIGIFSVAYFAQPSWEFWAREVSPYFRLLTLSLFAVYLAFSLAALRRSIHFDHQISAERLHLKYKWLKLMFCGVAVIWISDFAQLLFVEELPSPYLMHHLTKIVVLWILTVFALRYSRPLFEEEVYFAPPQTRTAKLVENILIAAEGSETTPLKWGGLDDNTIKTEAQNLLKILKEGRAYLNPEFRLSDLARLIKKPSYFTSFVLNRGLQTNFFDLVNSLRIEAAKQILSSPEANSKTILEISYEVGYNSKSAFNSAFKRWVGTTPKEFRQMEKSA